MSEVELTKRELEFLLRVVKERVGWDVGYSEGLYSKLERAADQPESAQKVDGTNV